MESSDAMVQAAVLVLSAVVVLSAVPALAEMAGQVGRGPPGVCSPHSCDRTGDDDDDDDGDCGAVYVDDAKQGLRYISKAGIGTRGR